jgi:hypothetical protein
MMYPDGLSFDGTVLMSFRACSRDAYDSRSIFLDAESPTSRHILRMGKDTRIPFAPYV